MRINGKIFCGKFIDMKRKLYKDNESAIVIAEIRGLAFAITTGFYTLCGGTLLQSIWAVYLGFLVTVALGRDKAKPLLCISSFLIGDIWSILYIYIPKMLTKVLPLDSAIIAFMCELFLTGMLLFLHLTVLSHTCFRIIPFIFLAIAIVFMQGGYDNIFFILVSVMWGIIMASVSDILIQKVIMQNHYK